MGNRDFGLYNLFGSHEKLGRLNRHYKNYFEMAAIDSVNPDLRCHLKEEIVAT